MDYDNYLIFSKRSSATYTGKYSKTNVTGEWKESSITFGGGGQFAITNYRYDCYFDIPIAASYTINSSSCSYSGVSCEINNTNGLLAYNVERNRVNFYYTSRNALSTSAFNNLKNSTMSFNITYVYYKPGTCYGRVCLGTAPATTTHTFSNSDMNLSWTRVKLTKPQIGYKYTATFAVPVEYRSDLVVSSFSISSSAGNFITSSCVFNNTFNILEFTANSMSSYAVSTLTATATITYTGSGPGIYTIKSDTNILWPIDLANYVRCIEWDHGEEYWEYRIYNDSNRTISADYYIRLDDTDSSTYEDSDTVDILPGDFTRVCLESDYAISNGRFYITCTAENAEEYYYDVYY